MKVCTKCGEAKPLTEFWRHPQGVNRLQPRCKFCLGAAARKWAVEHPDRTRVSKAKSADKCRGKRNASLRAAFASGPEIAERIRRWRRDNPGKVNALVVKRRASKLNATPAWADHALMRDIYTYAAIMRKAGVDCQVDHEVPLQSPEVCGLHTSDNLTVVLSEHNRAKGNRHWPDSWAAG